jgi:hypothetical protein
VNCFTFDFCEGPYGDVCSKAILVKHQWRPAVTTFIKALTLVFALAAGTSMMSLTVHTDPAHFDQDSPYRGGHQKTALLY